MSWSIIDFTGQEMIKLAVEIEIAGKLFYEKASQKVDDSEIKDLLVYLGGEETKHISDFRKLGESLPNDMLINESYVGEYGDYLKSIIDSHVFNQSNVDALVSGIMAPREALAIALRFEKDSIVIFQEFRNVVNDSGKGIVDELINQEKGHIRKLADLSRSV